MYYSKTVPFQPNYSYSKAVDLVTGLIYSFHMPAFFAISGAIYYIVKCRYKRYDSNRKFVKNKFLRLIVPYLFFSLIIVAPISAYLEMNSEPVTISTVFNDYILLNNPKYLWFLPTLFLCFLIVQFLFKFINRYRIITIAGLIILYYLGTHISFNACVNRAMTQISYFHMGFLLADLSINKQWRVRLKPTVVLSVLLFIAVLYISVKVPHGVFLFNFLTAVFGTIALFSLSAMLSPKISGNTLFKVINKNSFGIYLFNVPILYLIFFQQIDVKLNVFMLMLIVLILSMALAIMLTVVFRKIPLCGKALIGEKQTKRQQVG